MEDKIIENHHVCTMEHEMRVQGYHLLERKQKTLIVRKVKIKFKNSIIYFSYFFKGRHQY